MAQVSITQLPQAQALVGTEAVPIVQNGVTVQTTTSAISGAGALNYPFLTVGSTSGLTQARQIAVGSGLSTADTGAGGVLTINLTGAAASLNSASNGIIVKTDTNTVVNRSIAVGSGMTISNADGISGNPTLGLSTNLQNLSSLTGTGLMTINGSTFSQVTLQGTTNSISIANANGVSGTPTFSIASDPVLSGTGGLQVPSGTTAQRLANNGVIRYNTDSLRFEFYEGGTWVNVGIGDGTVTYINGTANQIQITNPTTTPTISLVANPTLPGNAFVQLPIGTTAQRGTPTYGALRYNTDINLPEIYTTSGWGVLPSGTGISTFSAGTTGLTPSTPTAGGIVLNGVLNSANGGTGVSGTLTGYVYGNGISPMTASTTIPTTALSGTITNAQLTNSAITINGNSVSLGSSTTVTASTTSSLTIGTGLSGTSFNGSTPVTIAIDSTVATLIGIQTLTNKTISGASNTLTNIGNSSLTNSSITYNGVTVALGASGTITAANPNALTIGTGLSGTSYNGSAPVTIAIDSTVATLTGIQTLTNKTISGTNNTLSNIGNSALTNSSVTIGSTNLSLGGTLTTFAGTSISGSTNTLTNIPNSALTNSSITINGNAVSLGGSTTVTASTTNTLTIGTGLSGTSFNGSAPVTIALANSGVTTGTYGSSAVIPVITVNAQGQITSISTQATNAPAFQSTWNATTNSPTLTSSVGTQGNYYVVSVAGNITLNGVSGWNIGDWAIFQNGVWAKIPGSTTESFTNLITTNLQVGGLTGYMYANNTTGNVSASTTIPTTALSGTITNAQLANSSVTIGSSVLSLGGTLSTLASVTISGASNTLTNIGNSSLTNSSVTINGSSVSLGGSVTVTATATNALTIGTGLSGTSYNGSTAVTIANTGVLSFSAGTTGLTPSTATTGAVTLGGTLNVGNGGTGLSSTPANGQIDIGNGTGFTRTTLTAGSGITVTNASGSITIASSVTPVTSVTGTAPVVSSGGTTPAISMAAATTSVNGYLTSTDWNTFNNKQPAGTYVTAVTVVSANGFTGSSSGGATPALTLGTSITGLLKGNGTAISAATSGTDYAPATSGSSILYGNGTGGFSNVTVGSGLSFAGGTLSASASGVTSVSGTAPISVATGTTTPVVSMTQANTSTNGYLSSTDWNTFNNKQPAGSYLTAVTADAPLSGSGTSGSHLVIAQANTTTSGYLSSTDWNTFNGKQAALVSGTNIKTVGGVSLLGSGDVGLIGGTYGGTGVNNGASTITVAGNLSHAGAFTQTFTATANTSLTLPTSGYLISTVTNMAANPVTGTPSSTTFLRGDGTWASPTGSGTVTSVAQSFTGGLISVAGSPITGSGTLALTVAGTSGGIPYFSSGTTWASSAVLTASALMVGGGSGAAPSTITTGTGVVTALGNTTNAASGITVRDANNNIVVNSVNQGFTSVAASASLITLTAASTPNYLVTGSGGQTIKLPDATTLANGEIYTFNNNQSSGTIVVQNNSTTTVVTIQAGSFSTVTLLNNSTAAGTWDWHNATPSNASWSTNTLSWAGSITGLTSLSTTGQLTSSVATGTAPFVVSSTTQVANLNAATAGTATNVTLAAGTGATNYIPFSTTATGSSALTTNTLLTYNYTNNTLTAGISGGAF
jgi:hypothetical protein